MARSFRQLRGVVDLTMSFLLLARHERDNERIPRNAFLQFSRHQDRTCNVSRVSLAHVQRKNARTTGCMDEFRLCRLAGVIYAADRITRKSSV